MSNQMSPWPVFAEDEIEAVVRVLKSGSVNYWTGEEGRLFEKEYAEFVGCKHAIAVANGTLALEYALNALEVGAGDEVIVTSRTFMASASCIVLSGANVIWADVDRDSQNITRATIEPKITSRTKAIIAVHLAGWPCDMDDILELANEYNLAVIEDCAQAHGAEYKGRPIGSMGDMSAFSFCQDKILTTGGEGGMLLTNDTELWSKAWSFKDHGKSYSAIYDREHPPGFRWLHESFGTNGRLTEMQSAIGRIVLRKLPEWIVKRRQHAERLLNTCQQLPALRTPIPPGDIYHAYYKFYTFLRFDMLQAGWDRLRIIEAINAEGVPCYSGSCSEVYREKAFDRTMQPGKPLTVARELGETSLMFLVHPTLTADEIEQTSSAINKVITQATKVQALKKTA